MTKKKISQVKKELESISYWKWQFLRRNEGYIKSCEEWSERSRKQWKENEIVIGYPFKGQLPRFFRERIFATNEHLFVTKELLPYHDKFVLEWGNLWIDKETHEMFLPAGINPLQTHNQYSWKKYFQKYDLTLPINPALEQLPFFARFDIGKTCISTPSRVEANDMFLDRGSISAINVDWSQHKTRLLIEFSKHIYTNQLFLKANNMKLHREIDPRVHIARYPDYIKAWDAKNKDEISWNQISRVIFEGKVEHLSTIRKYVESAEKLIQGGYKNIG